MGISFSNISRENVWMHERETVFLPVLRANRLGVLSCARTEIEPVEAVHAATKRIDFLVLIRSIKEKTPRSGGREQAELVRLAWVHKHGSSVYLYHIEGESVL